MKAKGVSRYNNNRISTLFSSHFLIGYLREFTRFFANFQEVLQIPEKFAKY